MEGEAVGADVGGAGGAELGEGDAEAALGVDADAAAGAVDLDLFGLAVDELLELLRVFEVIDVGGDAGHGAPVEGVHVGADFAEQCGHVELGGLADAAAEHDDAVEDAGGLRDGVACGLAEAVEGLQGGLLVAVEGAVGDAVDVVGVGVFGGLGVVGQLAVVAQHGAERDAVLGDELLSPLAGRAVDFRAAVVAHVHLVVARDADAEAGAEDEADEVAVLLHAAGIADALVEHGQRAGQRLAVGEQVGVVVDEDGQVELLFEERAQSHAALKAGEVAQPVGDHAVGVVRRSGKGEADGHRLLGKLVDDVLETRPQILQQLREVVGVGGEFEGVGDRLAAPHRREPEMRAAGVQRDDGSGVAVVHIPVKFYGAKIHFFYETSYPFENRKPFLTHRRKW